MTRVTVQLSAGEAVVLERSTHNPDTIDTQYKLRVTGPDNLRCTPVAGV